MSEEDGPSPVEPSPRHSRVLICGSRTWATREEGGRRRMDYGSSEAIMVFAVLDGLHARHMRGFAKKWKAPFTLISGGAMGADSAAAYWAHNSPSHEPPGEAVKFGIPTFEFLEFEADWDTHGKRAGFLRNTQMLEEGKPNLVVAFAHDIENSKGTRMMLDIANKAFVETYVIE